MITLLKRLARQPGEPMEPLSSRRGLDESSSADLRQVIDELERAIAEHEATNAFLRDLLTERWFETEANQLQDSHALERL